MGKKIIFEPKLELVTAYHIRFAVKLLWKYCKYSIIIIFVEPNFLSFSNQVFNIFIRMVTISSFASVYMPFFASQGDPMTTLTCM